MGCQLPLPQLDRHCVHSKISFCSSRNYGYMFLVLPAVDKGSVASTTNAFASLTMDDRVSEEEEEGVPQELPEHACRCGGLQSHDQLSKCELDNT